MTKLKVAAIQMMSGQNKEKNLKQAERLIKIAVKKKVDFIALPEVFNYRGNLNQAAVQAETIPGYSTNFISSLAKKYSVWILIGSLLEKESTNSKPFNTSVLINPSGKIVGKYRKMHLFDIKLFDKHEGQEISESKRNQAGKNPKLVFVENIKLGMSICYDLRFPELYRYYSQKGAKILCVPSSFIKPTGEAHWHTLIKARAVENFCYVIAPNQAGTGTSGIKTYGHSLIVDPWGKILAEGTATGEAVITSDLDLEYLEKIRKRLPALEHRKIV